jgi:putative aminopeptidase FrvX
MTMLSDLLIKLSAAYGPSGEEHEVREIFRETCPQLPWRAQRIGNIWSEIKGFTEGPRIMVAAHMDEIGLMIQTIMESGWARFIPIGSWPVNALPAQQFRFRCSNGCESIGVVGMVPPHFLKDDERSRIPKTDELFMDFGVPSAAILKDIGLEIGDMGVPNVQPRILPTGWLSGKALDDRAGCAVLLEVLRRNNSHPNTLIPAGTVQEEVGTRGMRVAGRELKPDLAIIVEGAPTDERPGAAPQTAVGNGPQLRFHDATLIAHKKMVRWLVDLAHEEGIPYQTAVRSTGGTDGGAVQIEGEGVPTVVVGVPVRYAHSHHGLVDLNDVENTVRLISAVLQRMNWEIFRRIILEY